MAVQSVALVVALLAQLFGGPIGRPPAPVGDDQLTRDAGHALPSLGRNTARPHPRVGLDTPVYLPSRLAAAPTLSFTGDARPAHRRLVPVRSAAVAAARAHLRFAEPVP